MFLSSCLRPIFSTGVGLLHSKVRFRPEKNLLLQHRSLRRVNTIQRSGRNYVVCSISEIGAENSVVNLIFHSLGFGDRLLSEIKKLTPKDIKIRISAPQDRLYSTWMGGSILAALDTFKKMWVSKKEYDDNGARIIDQKTF